MLTPLNDDGFVFQILEEERVKTIKNSFSYKRYFTESASIPDLQPPKIGIYIVSFGSGLIHAIGIGVNTGTPQTLSSRIKIKRIIEFKEIPLDDILSNDDTGHAVKKDILSKNKIRIKSNYYNLILNKIAT